MGGYFENGYFIDNGKFTSPAGNSFESRALPASALSLPLKKYRVIKPISGVESGRAIPWFNQQGLGTQFKLPKGISQLVAEGFLIEIP